ncbi:MAG: tRNA (N(6)-L-threonylcarbamoyladenosine(37)-C(2))-methylthiotransferase MtaB [Clostridia bacterium]|nr:tRNA (N(6)-L-threonylcarbamoyladenosine(37)-C(2))-methylthiotransferase MtaB [Clostridia bacterium]
MKVAFYTLGCKVNQYETKAMRHLLEAEGYETTEYTPGEAVADVLVVNSCTVTGESDRKLRQLLRRCRRQAPGAVLVLTGCMPQAQPETAGAFTEVDIVLGNAARRELPRHLAAFLTHRQRIVSIPPHSTTYEPLDIQAFQGRTRAYVKIQDGCNRFCSYCIIPYARGRVRSRDPEDIRLELERLAEQGYKEVVLVGINLTAYGQDNGLTIADAVEAACAVEGLQRVRLGSLEPDYMDDATLDRLEKQEKLCPQFHLALQSGCDATLKRMNRHYTTAEYATLCDNLRRRFPGCAITTDVMVGFPGETPEEFDSSCRFVEQIGFARVHVFAYSRRPGTVADRLPGQVDNSEKARRSRRMISLCAKSAAAYADTLVGCTLPVLLETESPDGTVTGHTATYIPVQVTTHRHNGELVSVHITDRQGETLLGTEVN